MPERTELRSLARARTAGAAAAAADQLSGEAVEMVIRAKDDISNVERAQKYATMAQTAATLALRMEIRALRLELVNVLNDRR